MGTFYDEIPPEHVDWIKSQKIYFVATCPLSASSHVNLSPKGYSTTFNLTSPTSAWYLDLTGSGNETLSHLKEEGNGRITIMFIAFEGPPRILRMFGIGKVYELDSPEFNALIPIGDERRLPGARSIISIEIHKVLTSCGFSIPYFDYKEDRPTLLNWAKQKEKEDLLLMEEAVGREGGGGVGGKSEKGLKEYWRVKNNLSMDGMRGLEVAYPATEGEKGKKFEVVNAYGEKKGRSGRLTFALGMIWGALLCLVITELIFRRF